MRIIKSNALSTHCGLMMPNEAMRLGQHWSMMTSSNENISRIIGPLWGESTGHQWIPVTKASSAEFCCFLWSAFEQTVEQTIETPVILDAIALIMTSLQCEAMI